MTKVPTPDDIAAEWITERLREQGHEGAVVKEFSTTRVGTGQSGLCLRFELNLEGADDSTPRTLIGKFPSDDPITREAGVTLETYASEVTFYRDLAPRMFIRLPRCYYADIDGLGPDFLILMEDMYPAVQGDQLAGCTAEVARAAVLELVGLQVPSWCDASMHDYFGYVETGPFGDMKALYNQGLPKFLKRFEASLEDDEIEIFKGMGAADSCPTYEAYAKDAFSLEHFDYRLDNLLIDESTSPPRMTTVDWAGVRVGKPLHDVALFMGSGLEPDVRRAIETDIIRDYHAALLEAGVENFSRERCWKEYRRGVFSGFALTVLGTALAKQTERGDAMFLAMARRLARQALDLDSWEFLD